VEFAQAGFIAGAADRLYRTPSAITRQLQRLEAALGARGCRGLLGVKNGLT
jgi:DNA-binding transcriptional LysR family regulator